MNEQSKLIRWFSIVIGFIGMLIILHPGFAEISLGTWLVLGGTIFIAVSKLMTKALSRTESPSTIVAYMSLTLTVVSFFPAAFVWIWPTPEMWLWLIGMGSLGSVAHVIQAQSYKDGDVTLIEPAGFVRLVWAALVGFIIFGEVPLVWSWIGGAVIMVGVVMLIRTEARTTPAAEIKT